ncbi:MAG: hypothetical protein WBN09_02950 [Woeseiaceae bacterium]
MTLLFGIAALLLGPLIYTAAARQRRARHALDLVISLAIGVIIVVHIIPEAWQHAGVTALVFLVIGGIFPTALERLFRQAHQSAHLAIIVLASTGLILHAAIDGMALVPTSGGALAWAIVLHRLPVGMAIWSLVRPNFGVVGAVIVLATITLATCAGYFLGNTLSAYAESTAVALFQAFVAGSLAHVALFGAKHRH